jgi:hypothetical protein
VAVPERDAGQRLDLQVAERGQLRSASSAKTTKLGGDQSSSSTE